MSKRYQAYSRLKLDYPSKRILRITFDRPETYNSVDAETHTQLTNIWRDINDDPDINAVIVTGAGKAFSAGGDFELIKSILDNPVARMATSEPAVPVGTCSSTKSIGTSRRRARCSARNVLK